MSIDSTGLPVSLDEWLNWIERRHSQPIVMGLERVGKVRDSLHQRINCPLFLVAGTNGKGSTCAFLEQVLLCAGYRVGLYTSPHLLRYNERVRVNGMVVDDAALCAGFARVEAACQQAGDVPLTYFEYGTLCALEVFLAQPSPLDALILEVGLGGRLDATNIYEPDCAIVTGVDLDHQAYLGDTREKIGFEKAGIYRPGKVALCADPAPPQSLIDHVARNGAKLLVFGRDYGVELSAAGSCADLLQSRQWLYWSKTRRQGGLAYPALRGDYQLRNAATAIKALETQRERLPVTWQDIRRGLAEVELPGRFQVLPGRPTVVLDVAHNPQAAHALASNLDSMGYYRATYAVFGMLKDKDIAAVITALTRRIDHWLSASLTGARAASADDLAAHLVAAGASAQERYASVVEAYEQACRRAGENDRIVVFGSFLTVAAVMLACQSQRRCGQSADVLSRQARGRPSSQGNR